MKINSKVLTNKELSNRIVKSVEPYYSEILNEFAESNVIELIGLKINRSSNEVYIMFNDYTEENEKLKQILSEAVKIKNELATETDHVKIALMQNRLVELSKEFNELKSLLGINYEFYNII